MTNQEDADVKAEDAELLSDAEDWQKQFHQLEDLCVKAGLPVAYGATGEVTLDTSRLTRLETELEAILDRGRQ